MNRKFFLFLNILFALCFSASAQSGLKLFETYPDSAETKILVGFISKEQITEDTVFAWYKQNLKYARPNKEYVEIIKPRAYDFQIILFIGSWCHDSQQILPKYLSLLEAAEFPDHKMTIIACDRQKIAPANMQRPLNVVNVPTLIVMKDGKELGRIVEYGASGLVDKELAEIVGKM
jgi:thiol-disulfide isomerase/thioredoxin